MYFEAHLKLELGGLRMGLTGKADNQIAFRSKRLVRFQYQTGKNSTTLSPSQLHGRWGFSNCLPIVFFQTPMVWCVPWNRPVAFALLLAFSPCLSGGIHTRSRGEGLQYFRPCALA